MNVKILIFPYKILMKYGNIFKNPSYLKVKTNKIICFLLDISVTTTTYYVFKLTQHPSFDLLNKIVYFREINSFELSFYLCNMIISLQNTSKWFLQIVRLTDDVTLTKTKP